MTCLMFLLLAGLCLWFSIIHLLNSETSAGQLARKFTDGLIEKAVGNAIEPKSEEQPVEEPASGTNAERNLLRRAKQQ